MHSLLSYLHFDIFERKTLIGLALLQENSCEIVRHLDYLINVFVEEKEDVALPNMGRLFQSPVRETLLQDERIFVKFPTAAYEWFLLAFDYEIACTQPGSYRALDNTSSYLVDHLRTGTLKDSVFGVETLPWKLIAQF